MPNYTLRQGDCLSSVAEKHGFTWESIWNHPNNASLKQMREDPNVIYPGDILFIPERLLKEEPGPTERRHRFKKKNVPAKLRLQILEEYFVESSQTNVREDETQSEEMPRKRDRARTDVNYVLNIDGQLFQGVTDQEGMIEVTIPPKATRALLTLDPTEPTERVITLQLGHMNPLSQTSGVKQRLKNLGYDCRDLSEEDTEELAEILRAFQEKYELQVTGEANQETREKLRDIHGC